MPELGQIAQQGINPMKSSDSSRTLERLPSFQPVKNRKSHEVIWESVVRVALNEVLDECLVAIVIASLHPE
jgi:hypothetical protein